MTIPAVLLLIGAAVIGPIEAQGVDVENPPPPSEWVRDCLARNPLHTRFGCEINSPGGKTPSRRLETTAELCERAMREVGAAKDIRNRWWLQHDPLDVNVYEVRCIPVPAGYRK